MPKLKRFYEEFLERYIGAFWYDIYYNPHAKLNKEKTTNEQVRNKIKHNRERIHEIKYITFFVMKRKKKSKKAIY